MKTTSQNISMHSTPEKVFTMTMDFSETVTKWQPPVLATYLKMMQHLI